MTEEWHRRWDIAVKGLAVVATLLGIYAGYEQFISEFQLNNRKPYIELRTKYYLEMLETVSKVTYPVSKIEQEQNIKRFWQLYVGVSTLVEDSAVEEKVNSLSECIRKLQNGCEQFELESMSLSLANAVKGSLLQSWQIETNED